MEALPLNFLHIPNTPRRGHWGHPNYILHKFALHINCSTLSAGEEVWKLQSHGPWGPPPGPNMVATFYNSNGNQSCKFGYASISSSNPTLLCILMDSPGKWILHLTTLSWFKRTMIKVLRTRMVRMTALDIQASLRNPTAMLEDSMTSVT